MLPNYCYRNVVETLICLFFLLQLSTSTSFAEDTIKIPVMLGQTGASSVFGAEEFKGYTLAVEEWNSKGGIAGKKIELQVEDTQTSQASIVSGFYRIAMSNPAFILGPTWLDGFPAIIPLAEKKEIALVTPSASVEAFGRYAGWPISFYFNTTVEIQTLIADLKQRKIADRVALIYQADPYAELVRKLILTEKVNVVEDIGVQAGEMDFRASLARLSKKKPDVVIILVWDEKSLLSLFQQINIVVPNLKLASIHDGDAWCKHPTFSPHINQLIFTRFLVDDQSFLSRFQKRFNAQPLLTASTAYDAANNVFIALNQGVSTGKGLHDFLTTRELDTATFGKVRLTQSRGIATSRVVVEEFLKD